MTFARKLRSHLPFKIISLLLAIFLWFFVIGRRSSEIGISVPVRLENLPASLVIVNNPETNLEVRIQGPQTLLSSLDPNRLNLSLDLSGAKPGRISYHIFPEQITLPRGLRVNRINPSQIDFEFSAVVTRELPVRIKTEGECAPGYRISQISVTPPRVTLTGADRELKRMDFVETDTVSLKNRDDSFVVVVPLVIGGIHISRLEPQKVEIQVEITETLIQRWFRGIPIEVTGLAEGRYQVRPTQIELLLKGPELVLSRLQPGEIKVFLEGSGLSPGKHRRRAIIELPAEVQLLDSRPPWFTLEVSQ